MFVVLLEFQRQCVCDGVLEMMLCSRFWMVGVLLLLLFPFFLFSFFLFSVLCTFSAPDTKSLSIM